MHLAVLETDPGNNTPKEVRETSLGRGRREKSNCDMAVQRSQRILQSYPISEAKGPGLYTRAWTDPWVTDCLGRGYVLGQGSSLYQRQ